MGLFGQRTRPQLNSPSRSDPVPNKAKRPAYDQEQATYQSREKLCREKQHSQKWTDQSRKGWNFFVANVAEKNQQDSSKFWRQYNIWATEILCSGGTWRNSS
jgi:hypothetical protein